MRERLCCFKILPMCTLRVEVEVCVLALHGFKFANSIYTLNYIILYVT